METLLLEIGTEEIPAGYIVPALAALKGLLEKRLTDSRIGFTSIKTYGTPRRMIAFVQDIAPKQESVTTEVIGPPKNVAFDKEGQPTMAAKKFAEKVGIAMDKVKIKETPKGQYLCATKTERGLATINLLKQILPDIIVSIPFPKTMKWADLNTTFARPIQSILALLGQKTVSFTLGNIKSGRTTTGHRFLSPKKIQIKDVSTFLDILEQNKVLPDIAQRRACIEQDIKKAAADQGGQVLYDPELLDIVTNLVEYSAVSLGKFDHKYLELPHEVLITAMREHQKYFAVVDKNQNLMPNFIAVNNTPAKDLNLVAKGHERVLRARLEDARFFYQADLQTSLESLLDKLKGVLFQAKLGTMYEKVMRIVSVTEFLSKELGINSDVADQAKRAALLCKSDLVTQVVGEFPKLQGIMGRVYAHTDKEPDLVPAAIEEHYRPVYSGAPLPETLTGSIVSIADKIDSICGCFAVGLIPTGASDPYALRRQSIGLIQIVLKQNFAISLQKLIHSSLSQYENILAGNSIQKDESSDKIFQFLKNRMSFMLAEEGFSKDVISAVVDTHIDHIPNVWHRVKALQDLKSSPDFDPIAIAFKRVVNIIRQAEANPEGLQNGAVNAKLFEKECETQLHQRFQETAAQIMNNLAQADFVSALSNIASLRGVVDDFFDGVMVMDKDEQIRQNRLALLKQIADLFNQFADFSKIQI